MAGVKRETKFRRSLVDRIIGQFGNLAYCQVNHGSEFSAGLPDTEFVVEGQYAHVELKAVEDVPIHGHAFDWSQQPTALQLSTLRRIGCAGGNARVLVYFHSLDRVYCRTARWVFDVRGGLLKAQPAVWLTRDLDALSGQWDWSGSGEVELRQMLFGEVP